MVKGTLQSKTAASGTAVEKTTPEEIKERGNLKSLPEPTSVRGLPVGGRTWKSVQTKRTSSMKRPNAGNFKPGSAFLLHMAKKKAATVVKDIQKTMKGERDAAKAEARLLREERERRKAENAIKTAQMQTIDAAKLKKMNKKQLRQIKRTRVNKLGVVELVGAYQK